ncbi:hypothetical protein BG004_007296 [Podila humilis]|nr:hypothetical protein BG004_007296 [Podila humilis]
MSAHSFYPLDSDSDSDNAGAPLLTGNEGGTSYSSISTHSFSYNGGNSDDEEPTPLVSYADVRVSTTSNLPSSISPNASGSRSVNPISLFAESEARTSAVRSSRNSSTASDSSNPNHPAIRRMEGDIDKLETAVVAENNHEVAYTSVRQRIAPLMMTTRLPTPRLAIIEPIRRHVHMHIPNVTLSQSPALPSSAAVATSLASVVTAPLAATTAVTYASADATFTVTATDLASVALAFIGTSSTLPSNVDDNDELLSDATPYSVPPLIDSTGDSTMPESNEAEDNEAKGSLPVPVVPQHVNRNATYIGDAKEDGALTTTSDTNDMDMVDAQSTAETNIENGFLTQSAIPLTSSEETHAATQFTTLAQDNEVMLTEPMVVELDDMMVESDPCVEDDSDVFWASFISPMALVNDNAAPVPTAADGAFAADDPITSLTSLVLWNKYSDVNVDALEQRLATARMLANNNIQAGASTGRGQEQSEGRNRGNRAEAAYTALYTIDEEDENDEDVDEEFTAADENEGEYEEDEHDDDNHAAYHAADDGGNQEEDDEEMRQLLEQDGGERAGFYSEDDGITLVHDGEGRNLAFIVGIW